MQIKFNHKVYEKNKSVKADNGNGLGRLCFDIFKYYLDINIDKTYQELQKIFNASSIHKNFSSSKSTKSVIFNESDFKDWYDNHSSEDSKRNDRYFGFGGYSEPIEYNGEKLYFTTQWGNTNIPNMINFARQNNFDIEVIEDLLEMDKNIVKNIILYGSPGVGKTYSHKKLIALIEGNDFKENEIFDFIINNKGDEIEDGSIEELFKKVKQEQRMKFITFHQSFGYEDFIEGFRPNENGDIKLQDGIFKTICDDVNNEREKNYYLVIDEINRGNISKIFGELITLIEEDKRDTIEVTLPYSKKPFKIPSNLYIIGTMNSTDKSIALIDIALRRRFTFLKMKPKADLINYPKARQIFEEVNNKITKTLGEDYQIGHSDFMKIQNDDDLDFVLEYKIIPLLEEYYYGDDRLTEMIALCKLD